MEKFGMSFGGGPSRKELQETVESQKKQLVQYQTRFRDVVRAYKSLLKEKEALEASLKVLSVSQDVEQTQQNVELRAELPDDRCSQHSEDSVDTTASLDIPLSVTSDAPREEQSEEEQPEPPDAGGISPSSSCDLEQHRATPPPAPEADRRLLQLKAQLSTLTSSLATVTQEKSRMEASFLADKRLLKQEVEDLQEELQGLKKHHEVELQTLQEQLAESRARIITQQHERGLEQGDHAHQLRELQRLLQQERDLRQDAELRLHETAAALALTSQAMDRGAETEAHLNVLKEERAELEKRLKAAEEVQNIPDPRVAELQQELSELKKLFQQQIHNDNRRVSEAEERERERARAEEQRVAALEQQVSELSELLGSCEKAKQRDQQIIQRLRDRTLQLDTENKTLAIAASSRISSDALIDDSQLDVTALKEKLEKVKKLLVLAAQRNPEQNIEASDPEPESCKEKASVQFYQQELRTLRDEFERYKVRAQVVLKNKNAKDGSQTKELEEVRDQLAELKEKYINLRIQSDEAEARHRKELEERQQQSAALQHTHKQDVERLEALHRENLLRLEAELHKQRERTMALLDEKDKELESLRAVALSYSLSPRVSDEPPDASEPRGEDDVVGHALLQQATPTEPTLLLYAEQLARREVEAGALRRQKHQLQEDVHQLQAKLIANGERHEEEAAELRARLDKLLRDQSREGANLEYLKNVIFRFLTLQDASGRQQTLGAILTILHFSPQEKQAVLKLQGAPWWSAAKR